MGKLQLRIGILHCVKITHDGFSKYDPGDCAYVLHYAYKYSEFKKVCIKKVFEDNKKIVYLDTFNRSWIEGELDDRPVIEAIIEANLAAKVIEASKVGKTCD